MAVCKPTDTKPVKLPPFGVIVGVATPDKFTARLKIVVLLTPAPVPVTVIG